MALDPPALADFRARYPAFATVPDDTVTYWLADATRYVDESWPIEGDRDPAMMAHAAHSMFEQGLGTDAAGAALASGLTQWRSGSAALQFSDAAAQKAADGGLEADRYGREYLALLRRNKGGPSVTAPGRPVPSWPCGPLGWAAPFPPFGGW